MDINIIEKMKQTSVRAYILITYNKTLQYVIDVIRKYRDVELVNRQINVFNAYLDLHYS